MELTLSTCFVQVSDPDAALHFYRDVLGLELRNDVANGEHRWITLGAPSEPAISLVVTNFVNGGPEDSELVGRLLAKGAMNGVHFHADDLDAAFERMRGHDVEVVSEPADQPWGVRDFAVRDPAGNLVRVDQRSAG
jgi:catechol 2,3-dioxygenase-like lactoylglutathione lyase family enzyme